jgi:DNA-binding LytR/AlgR family response regulator
VRTRESLAYLVAHSLFVLTIVSTFGNFHSMYFYYIVTGMMAFLIIRETHEFSYEKILRKTEEQQVVKLQLKLDQIAQQKSPTKLQLTCAGKVEFIPVYDISYCKAAGDYVEIFMTDKRQSLFSGTLKSIDEKLPASFMKVHRSYIVNLEEVTSIASSTTGTSNRGTLVLKTGAEVPVSRRILPQVRGMIKNNMVVC